MKLQNNNKLDNKNILKIQIKSKSKNNLKLIRILRYKKQQKIKKIQNNHKIKIKTNNLNKITNRAIKKVINNTKIQNKNNQNNRNLKNNSV